MLSAMFDFSPESLVSFSIVIEIWWRIKTALSLSSQEENLTLPHPVIDSIVMYCKLVLDNV